jgi:DNA-binding beta-propeller fold protein YncE
MPRPEIILSKQKTKMMKKTRNTTIQVILLLCFLSVFACSCAGMLHRKAKVKKEQTVFYPPAPDTAHMQYLTSISGSDFMGKRTKFAAFIMGAEDVAQMVKPYGINLCNDKLYVCDPGIGGLEIIDFKNNKYSNFTPGSTGSLKSPLNCFVDKNDFLYVADPGRHELVLYDSAGDYLGKITDTGEFKPTDVMIDGDEIWVTNPDNHRLNVYDKHTKQLLRYFAEEYGPGDDGFLYSPFNIYVTADIIYITDFGDFRIKKYDRSGKFLSSIGSYGTGVGQFVRPKGIAVDKDANLFVVDAGFENTQMFNEKGQLLMFFGGPYKGPGDMWLPAKVIIDYDNLDYFKKYVDPRYTLNYLVLVSNQYGPDKINIYGAISPAKN